jgi:hypothetical protein
VANGALLLLHLDSPYWRLHAQPGAKGPPLRNVDRLAEGLLKSHLSAQEAGPRSSLYLAVRAARRAVAETPADKETWFLLGQLYFHLAWSTGDLGREQPFGHLALTRQAQAMAAVQRALQIDPDHERAHGLMAELAQRAIFLPAAGTRSPGPLLLRRNLELELKHRREQVRCARKNAPAASGAAESRRLTEMEKQVQALAESVGQLRDRYEVTSVSKPTVVKGELALDMGLVETALQVFLGKKERAEKKSDALGAASGPARIVELLISMGHLEEAAAALVPEHRRMFGLLSALGVPAWEWFQFQVAAASGDYEQADEYLGRLAAPSVESFSTPSGRLASAVGHLLLWDAPLAAGMPWQPLRRHPFLVGLPSREGLLYQITNEAVGLLQRETDLLAVRGCVNLEAGATASALNQFRLILERCQYHRGQGKQGPVFALRALPVALRYAALLEANGAAQRSDMEPEGRRE